MYNSVRKLFTLIPKFMYNNSVCTLFTLIPKFMYNNSVCTFAHADINKQNMLQIFSAFVIVHV